MVVADDASLPPNTSHQLLRAINRSNDEITAPDACDGRIGEVPQEPSEPFGTRCSIVIRYRRHIGPHTRKAGIQGCDLPRSLGEDLSDRKRRFRSGYGVACPMIHGARHHDHLFGGPGLVSQSP
jgi:hypothetical protein